MSLTRKLLMRTLDSTQLPPPPAGDDLFNVLFLRAEGEDLSTVILDSSGTNSCAANGNVRLSTERAKSGSSSLYFDGTTDYVSCSNTAAMALGTEDFSIEMSFFPLDGNERVLIDFRGTPNQPYIYIDQRDGGVLLWSLTGVSTYYITEQKINLNAWNHVALTRSGTAVKLFLNGVQQNATVNTGASFLCAPGKPWIGCNYNSATSFKGFMDNIRISKGIPRYTANFNPELIAY